MAYKRCKFCKVTDSSDRMYWVKRKGKRMSREYFHLDCYKDAWKQNDNKQQSH